MIEVDRIRAVVPKGTVFVDEADKTSLETRNGVIQARFVFHTIKEWAEGSDVTPDLVLELQRIAVNQIYRCAGHVIYQPPDHDRVRALVQEMCGYANQN